MDVGSFTGAEGSGRVKVKIAKYCHQCHRIAKGVAVSCKARKGNKFCSVRYCQKCLQNRYKQTAEVVALDDCWRCPKCEGICNCCICRKKNVPMSSGEVRHPTEAFMGSSDGALLGKNSARFLDAVPKDAGTENHVITLSNDNEKKRERVEQGGCSMQDGSRCIPVTKVMGVLFALNRLEQDFSEVILPQERHK